MQKESAAIRASFREESGDANIRSAMMLLKPALAETETAVGETM